MWITHQKTLIKALLVLGQIPNWRFSFPICGKRSSLISFSIPLAYIILKKMYNVKFIYRNNNMHTYIHLEGIKPTVNVQILSNFPRVHTFFIFFLVHNFLNFFFNQNKQSTYYFSSDEKWGKTLPEEIIHSHSHYYYFFFSENYTEYMLCICVHQKNHNTAKKFQSRKSWKISSYTYTYIYIYRYHPASTSSSFSSS